MNNTLRRLILAFCISATGYFATEDWYKRTNVSNNHLSSKNPIAQLSELTNEVQRKPLTRVIWETISKDEELYAGEAVRTSSKSNARIQFLKSGTTIELEPDSLVVLEESDKGLALDFLKGNMFVKSTGNHASSENLTLKSGKSKIQVGKGDLSLSKQTAGNVNVLVHDGQATITQGDKVLTIDENQSGLLNEKSLEVTKKSLRILTPKAGDRVYIDPIQKEKVEIQWPPLDANYKVYIERGETREKLTRNTKETATGNIGKIGITSKLGKFFWRIVAQPTIPGLPPLQSPIVPFAVLPKIAPLPLEPVSQANLQIENSNSDIKFRWANPAKLVDLILEIAKDPQLKQKIHTLSIDDKKGFEEVNIKEQGMYFWRITGFINAEDSKKIPVSSNVNSFNLKIGVDLIPPTLIYPAHLSRIPFESTIDKPIFLTWSQIVGIDKYEIIVEKKGKFERSIASKEDQTDDLYQQILANTVMSSGVKAQDLSPGEYRWKVSSLNKDDEKSAASEYFQFTITSVPQVPWANGPQPEVYEYYTQRPALVGRWLKTKEFPAESWRYRMIKKDSGEIEKSNWTYVKQPIIKRFVDSEGTYLIEVEALNSKNQVLAKSSLKEFQVSPKPLLPAPDFSNELPDVLMATRNGQLDVKWNTVNGAQKYQVLVKNKSGKVLRKETTSDTNYKLSQLQPGDYQVELKSIDQYNRASDSSLSKKLEVPKVSDIAAPKLKAIQVK